MPKMKTHRGSAKRFKRTGTGKLKRSHAGYKNHLTGQKPPKTMRKLRKSTLVSSGDQKRINQMIP